MFTREVNECMIFIYSKFQEFGSVRTLKIQKATKGPKKFPRLIDYEKPTKKEERKKKATFQKKKEEGIVNLRIFFWSKFGRFLYFESSNGFEFLKF